MTPQTDDQRDLALIRAARSGDDGALNDLLRRHSDRLASVCRSVVHDRQLAQDATQETLLRIVRRLETFDGRSRFTTWTHRIAVNASLDQLRTLRRVPPPTDDLESVSVERHTSEPESIVDRLAVRQALGVLPDDFRIALVLREFHGLSYQEISEALSVPIGTVRSRIARARRALVDAVDLEGTSRTPAESEQRP